MALGWLGAWGARTLRFEIEGAGSARRLSVPCSDVVWIGSGPDCQVALQGPGIEPRHLALFVRRGTLFVRDQAASAALRRQHVLRRLTVPAVLGLGPYRVRVSLGPRHSGVARAGRCLGRWLTAGRGAGERAHALLRRAALLVSALALAFWLARAAWHAPAQPPVAAAACAVERPTGAAHPHVEGPVSALRAVQLLRAGRRAEALLQYRALSARDDSPAPLAVVAGLLEYELSCPR